MNLKSKVLQTVPGTLLSGPLMTTHKSIIAIQLIPFRSRSLYPNDYWTAPTNRKFKFNHPELNKPPIFPLRFTLFLSWQIRLTKPVTYTTSLRVPSLSFPTGYQTLLILPLTCLGLLWVSVLLHPLLRAYPTPYHTTDWFPPLHTESNLRAQTF